MRARDNEKLNCECGGCYTRKNKNVHSTSKIHIYFMNTGQQFPCTFTKNI